MIILDGNYLEGGGQIVRTAVALSSITEKPVRITNIREGRDNPGLKHQHIHAINAAKKLCNAEVNGLELGSSFLEYFPEKIKNNKKVVIEIPTSGSISLVLQCLTPICLFSETPTIIYFKGGGTAGIYSPTIEYMKMVHYPVIGKIGVKKPKIKINKAGYYPKGGCDVKVKIYPWKKKNFVELTAPGDKKIIYGLSEASTILKKNNVSERQTKPFERYSNNFKIRYYDTLSIGSTICSVCKDENNNILGSVAIGEKGKTSERVGEECREKLYYEIKRESCVDKYMGDQLIPYLFLGCGGVFKTSKFTNHLKTNIWVCKKFLDKKVFLEKNKIVRVK